MSARPVLPSTWIPRAPYRGPSQRDPGVLKLDGNEGGAASPELLARLALESPSVLRDYPDPRGLEADIARSLSLDPRQVVLTTGADDALDRVCRAYLRPGRKAVLPIPTFEMMYRFIAVTGGGVETVPWADDFPTDEVIAALDGEVSLVVMISPNNPTGLVVTAEDLTRVAEAASGAVVLLDHAYVDYADEDLTRVAAELENVVTVRTFSKAWGLAGCRVGYAVASPEVAMVLRNAGNPFPVAGLSIAAVREQLLGSRIPMEEHVKRSREGRALLMEGLASLGADPLPSQGNFVFTDFGERATFVQDGLASLGIRVRRFSHRPEISTGLRITVPEVGEELERALAGLAAVMAPEALLFDLDGVLAGQANNDWILAQRILAERGVDVSLEDVTQRFQEAYLGTEEAPGLRESESLLVDRGLLERLAGRLPLGIVTGRPREEATWFLEEMGIADLFGAVVCMEDGPLKPDSEPVRTALSRLGVLRAWMVGDTPDDIRSSAAAGVVPLGIVAPGDDPTKAGLALRDAGAAVVLDDLTNLEELLP